MQRKKFNFKAMHIFDDNKCMTDEEFNAKPFVVEFERNKEFYEEAQRILDPNYAERQRQQRRIERTEKRRLELEQEAIRIRDQLQAL